jgi:WD40 repeat protein
MLRGRWIARCLAFSPDDSILAIGTSSAKYDAVEERRKGTVEIWSVSHKKLLRSIDFDQWVNSVSFSSDGKMLAVALGAEHEPGNDQSDAEKVRPGELVVLDTKDFSVLFKREEKSGGVWQALFSPTGATLAVMHGRWRQTGESNQVTIYDGSTFVKLCTLPPANNSYSALAFDPKSGLLAVADFDKINEIPFQTAVIEFFKLPKGTLQSQFSLAKSGIAEEMRYAPDGKQIAIQAVRTHWWDPKTGQASSPIEFCTHAMDYSLDSKWFVFCSRMTRNNAPVTRIELWRVATAHRDYAWELDRRRLTAICFSNSSKFIAIGGGCREADEPLGQVIIYETPEK